MGDFVNLTGRSSDNDLMLCTVTDTGYHFQPGFMDPGGTLCPSEDCLPTYVTNAELLALATVTKVWREVEKVKALAKHLHWALGWVYPPGTYDFPLDDSPQAGKDWEAQLCQAQAILALFEEPADAT